MAAANSNSLPSRPPTLHQLSSNVSSSLLVGIQRQNSLLNQDMTALTAPDMGLYNMYDGGFDSIANGESNASNLPGHINVMSGPTGNTVSSSVGAVNGNSNAGVTVEERDVVCVVVMPGQMGFPAFNSVDEVVGFYQPNSTNDQLNFQPVSRQPLDAASLRQYKEALNQHRKDKSKFFMHIQHFVVVGRLKETALLLYCSEFAPDSGSFSFLNDS